MKTSLFWVTVSLVALLSLEHGALRDIWLVVLGMWITHLVIDFEKYKKGGEK